MARSLPYADMDKILSISKRRGFVFQSSEIYGGLGATWDYGPLGVERQLKTRAMVHTVYEIYNSWLADFCKNSPDRLGGLALIGLFQRRARGGTLPLFAGLLAALALGLALLAAHPELVLVVLAYGYLGGTFAEMAWHRLRRHRGHEEPTADVAASDTASGL